MTEVSQPQTSQPQVSQPQTSQPATSQPATSQPQTSQPATSQPATSQPATSQPATSQPATSQPATSQPATSQPATSQPATSQPVTSQPPQVSQPPQSRPRPLSQPPQPPQSQAMQDFETALQQAELIAQGRYAEAGLGNRPALPTAAPGTQVDGNALAVAMAAQRDFDGRLQAMRNNNPLIAIVENHERTRTSEVASMGEANADVYYNTRINEMRQNAATAVQEDRANLPQRELSQQSMIQQLMSGNIMGVVMDFIKMIPGIGSMVSNAMSVPGEMLNGAMNGNGSLDVAGSFENVSRRNNFRSALMGATGNNQLPPTVDNLYTNLFTPPPAASAAQPSAPQTAVASAGGQPTFDAPNGSAVPAPAGPPGTQQTTVRGVS